MHYTYWSLPYWRTVSLYRLLGAAKARISRRRYATSDIDDDYAFSPCKSPASAILAIHAVLSKLLVSRWRHYQLHDDYFYAEIYCIRQPRPATVMPPTYVYHSASADEHADADWYWAVFEHFDDSIEADIVILIYRKWPQYQDIDYCCWCDTCASRYCDISRLMLIYCDAYRLFHHAFYF